MVNPMIQPSLMERMSVDPEKVSDDIVGFLQREVKENNKSGILLGLSGGIDSTVLATLATKAVGHSKVYALYLSGWNSQKKFLRYAQGTADRLKVNFEAREIGQSIKEHGIREPLLMKLVLFSRTLNKLLVYSSRLLFSVFLKESPYALSLKLGKVGKEGRTIHGIVVAVAESGFNMPHICRRKILEAYALEKNLLMVGAANKSESLSGWFVKDGVDDIPVEPLLGLYKNQIRQLARFLDIPMEIIDETPSPDMLRGFTDELVMGFPYEKMDKVFYVLEQGLDKQIVLGEGISRNEFEAIKNLKQLSVWKRQNGHRFPSF